METVVLMFEGAREGHEPWRFLATEALLQMFDTHSKYLLKCIPAVVRPIKLGLNTMEPSLVAHMLLLLQR